MAITMRYQGLDLNDENEADYLRSEQYVIDRQRDYEADRNMAPGCMLDYSRWWDGEKWVELDYQPDSRWAK